MIHKTIIGSCYNRDKRFTNIKDRINNIPGKGTKDIEQPDFQYQIKNHVLTINLCGEINSKND